VESSAILARNRHAHTQRHKLSQKQKQQVLTSRVCPPSLPHPLVSREKRMHRLGLRACCCCRCRILLRIRKGGMLVSRSFRRGEATNMGTDVKKLLDVCRRASFASDLVWSFLSGACVNPCMRYKRLIQVDGYLLLLE
jgi:hypothetical protein